MSARTDCRNPDCDLLVIGAGSGGVRAARIAAGLGAKVIIAEHSDLGGTCVNLGCVPKKLLYYAAQYHSQLADAADYGWQLRDNHFNWSQLIANKNREISRLNSIYRSLLEKSGVQLLPDKARFIDNCRVVVGDRCISARYILVATGSTAAQPDFAGGELAMVSDAIFHLQKLPARIIIVGGGYIAVEMAGILHRLGAHISMLYRGDMPLRGFDSESGEFLYRAMVADGIEIKLNCRLRELQKSGDCLQATTVDNQTIDTDAVLFAAGRLPRTADLGIENTDISLDNNGHIAVNADWQTSVENVFAVGDVIGPPGLTPVAIAEGEALVNRLFGDQLQDVDMTHLPTAVFGDPPLASVGLSEQIARALHGEIAVYKSVFRPLRYTLGKRQRKALIKLVAMPGSRGRVLGAQMVGDDAPEIIQALAVALRAGATIETFKTTLALHPTIAEEFVSF